MSKTLWHTIKIEGPKEMVNITKNNKVIVKKSLTKTKMIQDMYIASKRIYTNGPTIINNNIIPYL